jgi:predicted Zn-dependent peptidase
MGRQLVILRLILEGWSSKFAEIMWDLNRGWKWLGVTGIGRVGAGLSSLLLAGWLALVPPVLAQPGLAQGLPPEPTPEMLAQQVTASPTTSIKPYLDRVIQNTTEFTLANGLKFIVLERHQAPVVSFMTYANVGGVDEPPGLTGIAHFLEHLAFKGTQRIGTTDFAQEKALMAKSDQIEAQVQQARAEVAKLALTYKDQHPALVAAREKVAALTAQLEQNEAAAQQFVEQNEFGQLVERSGGSGLNATTSSDETRYFYSFPANKLELWMSLESERFLEPVFREFQKERKVILEERRLRTENSPIGQLIESFSDKAFTQHPYKRPVIGYVPDLERITRADVQKFFDQYYGPNNLTIAIVGDVNPGEVKRLAETYFGRFPKRSMPPQVTTVEPGQKATQEVTLTLQSQPWYLEGYHRPQMNHPDSVIYDAISSILSDGRTSRFYKRLVQQEKIALNAESFNGFPGDKFPNLIMFYALTAPGHTVDEVQKSIHAEIERLKTEPVAVVDLDRIKTNAKAGLLRSLDSNSGMAAALAEYQAKTGNWRTLFKKIDEINTITPADIQRVAKATFKPENRTIGRILSK